MQQQSNDGMDQQSPAVQEFEADYITDLFESKRKNSSAYYDEMALIWNFLRDVKLLERNKDLIKKEMFLFPEHALMFQGMIDSADRGAKDFKPKDIAHRMKDLNDSISVEGAEGQILFILSSDKDPQFYKMASRFWDNWRKRECNRKLEAAIAQKSSSEEDLEGQSDPDAVDKFDLVEEAMELRKKANPFAGRCKTARETLGSTWDILSDIWSGKMVFPKVSTGYPELDDLFDGGFDLGSFAVIGAATGHGKTAGAVNIAASMARQGTKVVFISLEETYRDLSMRLITSQSGVPRKHLISKDLITEREQRMAHKVLEEFSANENSLQLSCGGKNASEIVELIRLHHDRDGCKVFIVDYMQRIQMETENRTAEVARFSLALGELARDLELVIIGTSQLKREGRRELARRKPTTYDLSESSYLENEAAYILTLFRQDLVPELQDSDDYDPTFDNTIEFICCKQRNGMQASTHLNFDGPAVRITSRRNLVDPTYQQQYYQNPEANEATHAAPPYQPY